MIIVTGRTFDHRDTLIRFGGTWNRNARRYEFDRLSSAHREMLRNTVGLFVTDPPTPVRREPFVQWPAREEPALIGDDMTYHNYFADRDPISFFGFSSLSAMLDHVESLTMPNNDAGRCDIGWTAKPGYAGTLDMREALDTARKGWLDGLGLMSELVTPEPVSKRRTRSVTGGAVNVGRMLAGHPDHMTKRRKLPARRVITLFVETCMWKGITVNCAITRVVLIAAMVDKLEAEGYSCNIVAVYAARRRSDMQGCQTAVRIKDAGERLSLADISFAFGHPSFGRRFVYALEGSTTQCGLTREARGYIGQAFDTRHPCGPNEFYIPQILRNVASIWDMLDLIEPDGLPVKLRRD